MGNHEHWVRYWRHLWAMQGFRLADQPGRGRTPAVPPLAVATVTALARELPAQRDEPLSRYSTAELARVIAAHADAPPLSRSTIWRLLDRDALKPWRYRSWLFPRDPHFAEKAGRVLDLDAVLWEGEPLHPDNCILSADEETSIQARRRCRPSRPPQPGQPMHVEQEEGTGSRAWPWAAPPRTYSYGWRKRGSRA